MSIPAGIRKTGPWQVCLSGIVSTQADNNQYYLDRQSSLSVFHKHLGWIISGANSKHQPELASFSENLGGRIYDTPLSSRLQMSDELDRLSLAYNTFFADLFVPRPSEDKVMLRYVISGKGTPPEEARLTLQLCLKAGEELETATGKKIVLGNDRLDLSDVGDWIRHHGWTLKMPPSAKLVWPVYPYNPYAAAPEKDLKYAVGALSVSLRLKEKPGHYVRPAEQEIVFDLSTK